MEKETEISVGVILRKSPSKSAWLKWEWQPVGLIPGSKTEEWKLLREEAGVFEYHAGSTILLLHRAEVEAYKVALSMTPASAFVVMERDELAAEDHEYKVHTVTVSAYEAQDYCDTDEYLVEPVPMPSSLQAWVENFVDNHFDEKPFVKRKRDKVNVDRTEDGKGDFRIAKTADVFSSPSTLKSRKDH